MRGNTSRGRRLAFDDVADVYDRARPRFGGRPVADLIDQAGLTAGDRVLEVGAGTGQLTDALLGAGLDVVALEPGPRLAARLRSRMSKDARLTVVEVVFEKYVAPSDRFAAVVSANAFHWVDPDVSYRKAASLLAPGGALALMWNFPIASDAALQHRLNDEMYFGELAGMARDPDGYRAHLDDVVAAGRAQVQASGCFDVRWWHWDVLHREVSVADYVGFAISLADGASASELLRARAATALEGSETVALSDHVYASVATVLRSAHSTT